MPFSTIEEAVADIKAGKMVIMTDDENRENEGDLVMAAQCASVENVNFMAKYGRGLICATLEDERADELGLFPMTATNTSAYSTAFTVSVDSAHGITTGISAPDRSLTLKMLADRKYQKNDFVFPGHIFPLRAKQGGVLVRAGHTEASIDMVKLAGLSPEGVICEIMNEDGSMAQLPDLEKFAKKHDLKIVSVAQLINYRRKNEKLIKQVSKVNMPTAHGDFIMYGFKSSPDDKVHLALVKGDVANATKPVLIRVHSECLTGDVFHSRRCDCGDQLHTAMEMIEEEGCGAVIYMRQEGRGIGLENKLQAYMLQEQGRDTVEANEDLGFKADLREYGIGAQILKELGIKKFRLLTNNPRKVVGLEGFGLEMAERIPIKGFEHCHNERYLKTKKTKLGHIL